MYTVTLYIKWGEFTDTEATDFNKSATISISK